MWWLREKFSMYFPYILKFWNVRNKNNKISLGMNSEEFLESLEVAQHIFPKGWKFGIYIDRIWRWRYWPLLEKFLFFRDIGEHPEHDAKNCLSLPSPSPEKLLAEIHELKKPTQVIWIKNLIQIWSWFKSDLDSRLYQWYYIYKYVFGMLRLSSKLSSTV